MITRTNTIIKPFAMVIVPVNTFLTDVTMPAPWILHYLALCAYQIEINLLDKSLNNDIKT